MKTENTGISKNAVISELSRSPHGALSEYEKTGIMAAKEDPLFFSHLIAWNDARGQIRDSKVALPVIALTSPDLTADPELAENALAHILKLSPRELVRALAFSKSQKIDGKRRGMYRMIERQLRILEAKSSFDRTLMQHRESMKTLYAVMHIKPSDYANEILFKRKKVGVFADIANLKTMSSDEIAGTIARAKIPFLVASGALGKRMQDATVLQAVIGSMSPNELINNMKRLEKLGVNNNPALRATIEKGMQGVAKSKTASLKTSVAAEAVGGVLGEKLKGAQEKQLNAMSIEGDWLILADKSPSMAASLDVCRQIADVLARAAKGNVYLVYFDTHPMFFDVSGKTLEQIKALTASIRTGGGTNIGVGLDYMLKKGLEFDGIAVVSDGGDGSPGGFPKAYKAVCAKFGKDLPVYYYDLPGDADRFSFDLKTNGIEFTKFDLRTAKVDYYALPNIVATMRTNRYDLVDEIMATPLLKLKT